MRIKMLTIECGPHGVYQVGDERVVPDDVGHDMISRRYAERIVAPTPAAPTPPEPAPPEPAPAAHGKRKK